MTIARSARLSLFALLLAAVGYHASAQVVTVAGVTDPATLSYYTEELINTLNTANAAAQEVENGIQMIKYQEQALQSLGSGGWQGFVQAFDYETAAVNQYNAALQELPSLSQIDQVDQLVNSQGYQAALTQAQQMANSFDATDNLLLTINSAAVDTQQREQAASVIHQLAQSNTSPVEEAELQIQSIELLRGQLADLTQVAGASLALEQTQIENQQLETQLYEQWGEHFDDGTTTYQNVEPDASTVDQNSPAFRPH